MDNELKKITTLGIGGEAKEIVFAYSLDEFVFILNKTEKENIRYMVIGGGSNTLFNDNGFDGRIIVYRKGKAAWEGDKLSVEAGMSFGELVSMAIKNGICGFEKLVGIPGTVGGALWNNAGAYGQSISDYLICVQVYVPNKGILYYNSNEMEFGYRRSRLHKDGEGIALKAWFGDFQKESPKVLMDIARETLKIRNEKLPPPGWKTCGSFFQNLDYSKEIPERVHAGQVLEKVGAKTLRVGDAGMYEKHANILVNYGNAKAKDVIKLSKILTKNVFEQFGIKLKPEIKIL